MNRSNTSTRLTEQQLQHLIDRFDLALDLEDGVAVASRKNGRPLKAETVAKMFGMVEIPRNWREDEYGRVKNL